MKLNKFYYFKIYFARVYFRDKQGEALWINDPMPTGEALEMAWQHAREIGGMVAFFAKSQS